MADAVAASEVAPWVQAAGVVGFASLVYVELRAHRAELNALRRAFAKMTELVAVLLDRERRRGRERAPSAPVVVEADAGEDDGA